MKTSVQSVWTLIHGMVFGALYLLGCSGALMALARRPPFEYGDGERRFLNVYFTTMVVLAWTAVLTGTYIVYPWYRAVPPAGVADLALFPQRWLLSSPTTSGWHLLGMEWKEHVGWFVPISITPVAAIFLRYRRDLCNHPRLRAAALTFCFASFATAGVAGFFGAMIDKVAPVQGGRIIHISQERKR